MFASTRTLVTGFSIVVARLASGQLLIPNGSPQLNYSANWRPNINGGCKPTGYNGCVFPHILPRVGCNVQLQISGSSFQASFLKDVDGVTVEIYVDGQVVSQTSTYDPVLIAWKNCEPVVSDVIPLTDGLHNVTIATIVSPGDNSTLGLYFTGLSYQPSNMSSSPVTSSPTSQSPGNSTRKNKPVGAIAGGTIGGLAIIIFAATVFLLARRKGRTTSGSEPPAGTVSPFIDDKPSPAGNPNASEASRPSISISHPQIVPANVASHPDAVEVESTPRLPPYEP